MLNNVSVCLQLVLEVVAHRVCKQVYCEYDYYQDKSRAVSDGYLQFHVCTAGSQYVKVVGQSHALVEDAFWQLRQEVCCITLREADLQAVARLCAEPVFQRRILFSPGEKIVLALRLRAGEDVLAWSERLVKEFARAREKT